MQKINDLTLLYQQDILVKFEEILQIFNVKNKIICFVWKKYRPYLKIKCLSLNT